MRIQSLLLPSKSLTRREGDGVHMSFHKCRRGCFLLLIPQSYLTSISFSYHTIFLLQIQVVAAEEGANKF